MKKRHEGDSTAMRLKRMKLFIFAAVLAVIIMIHLKVSRTEKSQLQVENPFIIDAARGSKQLAYPTRAGGYIIPTKSAQEMRDMLLRHGARVNVDDNNINMPQNPFGNVSYDDNVAVHEQYQHEADILQQADLNPGHYALPTVMPKLEGENVVAMTLYGSVLKYTMGALKNAEIIKINFPGWKLRLYTETPSANARFGIVPQTVLDRLRVLGAEIHYIDPEEDWVPPMMWRFLVADDLWVDRFVIRDTDARLTQRDAAAVYDWVKSGKPFNCIRDHPSHASYALSGGMWGGKPRELNDILRSSWRQMMRGVRQDYLEDMNFLNHIIWPKVQNYAYCSDSVSCDQFPAAHPFPVPRYGYEHVGQVVSENELGRPLDIAILKQAGENPKCTPQGYNRLGMRINNQTNDSSVALNPG